MNKTIQVLVLTLSTLNFCTAGEAAAAAQSPESCVPGATPSSLELLAGKVLHEQATPGKVDPKKIARAAAKSESLFATLYETIQKLFLPKNVVHDGAVSAFALSTHGKYLTAGSCRGTVKIWDQESNALIYTSDYGNRILSLSFSPDGKYLAISSGRTIKLLNLTTGFSVQTLEGHARRVMSLAFNQDGTLLATGSDDGTIKMWSTRDGACLQTFHNSPDRTFHLAFHPNGRVLVSSSGNRMIKFWDIENGLHLPALQGEDTDSFSRFAFSPDAIYFAAVSDGQTVKLWKVGTDRPVHTFNDLPSSVSCLAFTPDSKGLIVGLNDKTILSWNVQEGLLVTTIPGDSETHWQLTFSPDLRFFAASSGNREIIVSPIFVRSRGELQKMLEDTQENGPENEQQLGKKRRISAS